jgi:tryptophan-rich sensory protein
MGISLYIVWSTKKKNIKPAIYVFAVQLVLNALWSFLFFGMQNPLLGFIEIIVLWVAIMLTILMFYRISKPAAWLLVPYLLWVSFAAVLNFSLWILNM